LKYDPEATDRTLQRTRPNPHSWQEKSLIGGFGLLMKWIEKFILKMKESGK